MAVCATLRTHPQSVWTKPVRELSTRGRLAVLILITALPALGLTIVQANRERAAAENRAREEIVRLTQLAALHQDRVVESARQMLLALSQVLPEMRADTDRCQRYLAQLLSATRHRYHSVGIVSSTGLHVCNADPRVDSLDLSDRRYFQLALATGQFAIGDYQIGRITGRPGINFAVPIVNSEEETTGVAYLALDLHNFNQGLTALSLPQYARISVIDRNGVILARHPEDRTAIGRALNLPEIRDQVIANQRGVFEATATDGQKRLFSYADITTNPDGSIPLSVLISIPVSIIHAGANRALLHNIAEIVLVTLLLIAGAWAVAERLVLRSIRMVIAVATRIRHGHLGARTGMRDSPNELSQIGHSIDNMAAALQERDQALGTVMHELRTQASTDALTGLHNRRQFRDILARELARAARNGSTVALVMVDLDHFKKVNDTHGHDAGDLVLRSLGALLRNSVRASDAACRFGGEEFALILPETTCGGAVQKAETVRLDVAGLDLEYDGKPLGKLSASFGVAVFPEHAGDADTLLRVADEALYAAKGAGRNRVMVFDASQQPGQASRITRNRVGHT